MNGEEEWAEATTKSRGPGQQICGDSIVAGV